MIEAKNLVYARKGEMPVIDGVSFRLYNGMVYGLTGEGSQELIAILCGDVTDFSGTVNLNGYDLDTESELAKRGGGYFPSDFSFCSGLTVLELLSLTAKARKLQEPAGTREIQKLLESTELDDLRERLIGNLTSAQKSRVGLAQALIGGTDRILLEESAMELTPEEKNDFMDLLQELKGERIVLFCTEDPDILNCCDAVLSLSEGKAVILEKGERFGGSLRLVVLGERDKVFDILSRIPGIDSCKPEGIGEDGSLQLDLTVTVENMQELADSIRASLENDGIEILSLLPAESGEKEESTLSTTHHLSPDGF